MKVLVVAAVTALLASGKYDSQTAVITQSASSNASGYVISLEESGAVEILENAKRSLKRVGSGSARRFFVALEGAAPLEKMNVRTCMKSASFGTTLTVAWRGATSPDLSCGGDAQVRLLVKEIRNIEFEAGFSHLRFSPSGAL